MYFEWKNQYSVGITEIDKQHRKLFEIGSRINDLAFAKDGYDHYDEIMEVLHELRDYTEYHFNYEEKLMDQYGYESIEKHKFEHFFVVKKLKKFENDDLEFNQKELVLSLMEFISNWISDHILKEDMTYSDFFHSKGVY